jgi:hypothetical protein
MLQLQKMMMLNSTFLTGKAIQVLARMVILSFATTIKPYMGQRIAICNSLTAIENRKDIENPLVNPAVALIQEDWNGTKESCGGLEQLIQFKKIFP